MKYLPASNATPQQGGHVLCQKLLLSERGEWEVRLPGKHRGRGSGDGEAWGDVGSGTFLSLYLQCPSPPSA